VGLRSHAASYRRRRVMFAPSASSGQSTWHEQTCQVDEKRDRSISQGLLWIVAFPSLIHLTTAPDLITSPGPRHKKVDDWMQLPIFLRRK